MNIGDRVSWNFDIDRDVVFGHIVESEADRVAVKWADGSGPTWTFTRSLIVL